MKRSRVIALPLLAVVCAASVGAVEVSVNQGTRYQVVEGIGGHGAAAVGGYGSTPSICCGTPWMDTVFTHLGVSIIRHEIDPAHSPSEGVFDPSKLNILKKYYFTRLRNRGIRIIGSVWSPPCWMKANRSCYPNGGDNVLEPRYYEAFADYLVKYVQMIKDSTGVELFAISPQNEPFFNNPFNYSFYNGESYAAMLRVVGPRIRAAFPNMLIFGPEHMCDFAWNVGAGYIEHLLRGSTAEQYLDAFAVHYNDEAEWPRFLNETTSSSKQLWQTETSGFHDTWLDSWRFANSMFVAFKHGKINAWVNWHMSTEALETNEFNIINAGVPTKRAHFLGQYARFVRPGAVMVDCSADDTQLGVLAFVNETTNALTVIVQNSGEQKTINLQVNGAISPDQFFVFRTSQTEGLADVGDVGKTNITIAANSVTTLTNAPSVSARDVLPSVARQLPLGRIVSAAIFGLDGTLVRRINGDIRLAGGAVSWNGRNDQGQMVSRGVYRAVWRTADGVHLAAAVVSATGVR